MNGGKEELKSPSNLHKKIEQKIKSLLCDEQFLQDAEVVRSGFPEQVKDANQLESSYIAETKKLVALAIEKGYLPSDPKFKRLPEYKSHQALFLTRDKKRSLLFRDMEARPAVSLLLIKYKLLPKKAWLRPVINFLFYKEFSQPFFGSLGSLVRITSSKKVDIPDLIQKLGNKNFEVVVKNEGFGENAVFIRLFENTSKQDVVAGWKYIAEVRDRVLGGRRYYPLKNLGLGKQIVDLDRSNPRIKGKEWKSSDWEKQNVLFGETSDAKIENKNISKIRINRHRHKKRFGTKS